MLIVSYLMSHLTPCELDAVGLELEPRVADALFAEVCLVPVTPYFPSRACRILGLPREHSMPGGYKHY